MPALLGSLDAAYQEAGGGMSDKPISVGDLVVVVRGNKCCGGSKTLGTIFRVTRIIEIGPASCDFCGAIHERMLSADSVMPTYFMLYKLKRIPPLSELEGETRDEEIHA